LVAWFSLILNIAVLSILDERQTGPHVVVKEKLDTRKHSRMVNSLLPRQTAQTSAHQVLVSCIRLLSKDSFLKTSFPFLQNPPPPHVVEVRDIHESFTRRSPRGRTRRFITKGTRLSKIAITGESPTSSDTPVLSVRETAGGSRMYKYA